MLLINRYAKYLFPYVNISVTASRYFVISSKYSAKAVDLHACDIANAIKTDKNRYDRRVTPLLRFVLSLQDVGSFFHRSALYNQAGCQS